MEKLLNIISQSGQGSFLAVLKVHGKEKSPGLINFCMDGCSLALDFKNKGNSTILLLKKLEKVVFESEGRIYLAKDSLMSSCSFKNMYPNWEKILELKDPQLTSDQWERFVSE